MKFTIKQARKYAGLTQKAMADRMKIDRTTYFRLEKNPLSATIAQINEISEITGIPRDDLFLPTNSTNVELQVQGGEAL